MEWEFGGRQKGNTDESYVSLEELMLFQKTEIKAGDGGPGNPWDLQVDITNRGKDCFEGVIRFQLSLQKLDSRFFLPAFLYGRNKGECAANGKWFYPRIREGSVEIPYSPWWMVRSDRLSHPAALAYEHGHVLGVSGSPYYLTEQGRKRAWVPGQSGVFYQYAGFGCSLEEGWLAYTLGYENAPQLFVNSDTIEERQALGSNCFQIEVGETIRFYLQLYDYQTEHESGVSAAIRHVYECYHEPPRMGSSIYQATEDLSEAIAADAWIAEGNNYSTQVYEREDGSFSYNQWFSISWTGGVEVAVPMLMAGLRLQRENMREQALLCIQDIVEHSMNAASGLPYDACTDGVWSVDGWWRGHMHAKGHASYLAGQAVYYVLKGYEYEKRLGQRIHTDWLEFAEKIICKMETTKNSDAEYPYIWSEKTGAGLEYDAFSGTWCLASAAYYCFLTGDKQWLAGLAQSEVHYYETYVRHMECYGTPLDTDKAVDSEGILAYCKAVHYLHLLTGEEQYLDHLRDGLLYEFSFKFCYNSPVQVPPLSKLGWSSCGGSVTSTCNPHIHPMSNNIVDEMLYYLCYREDSYIRGRMEDTVAWGCQTYNTYAKEYDYGRKGWMSERFCHSEALLVERYPDGTPASTWFALLPWGSSNIIEGMTGAYWEEVNKNNKITANKEGKEDGNKGNSQ